MVRKVLVVSNSGSVESSGKYLHLLVKMSQGWLVSCRELANRPYGLAVLQPLPSSSEHSHPQTTSLLVSLTPV